MVWYSMVILETHFLDRTTVAVFKMHLDMDVKYNDNKTTVRQTEVERFILCVCNNSNYFMCLYQCKSGVDEYKSPPSQFVSYESDLMCRTYTV